MAEITTNNKEITEIMDTLEQIENNIAQMRYKLQDINSRHG